MAWLACDGTIASSSDGGTGGVLSDGSARDGATAPDGGTAADGGAAADGASRPLRLVAYLSNSTDSYSNWAQRIDFTKMTHLNLAFALATDTNDWDAGAPDDDVRALVDAAHAAGTRVLISLGGAGGDATIVARYADSSNIAELAAKLDAFVAAHNFDGVDVDIEDPRNLGDNYSQFVSATIDRLRPEGKLVTAAVAQYLQDSMADQTLHQFDFLNVMIYSSFDESVNQMAYYTDTKMVPNEKLILGVGFFGTDDRGGEYGYRDLLAADPDAWNKDQTVIQGRTVNYEGMDTIRRITEYSKNFGGVMCWQLSLDVSDDHSLYRVLQTTL
jgi:GH18 family chitinase